MPGMVPCGQAAPVQQPLSQDAGFHLDAATTTSSPASAGQVGERLPFVGSCWEHNVSYYFWEATQTSVNSHFTKKPFQHRS